MKLSNTANAVLTNSNALGNAWFVNEIKSVQNADEAIDEIGTEDLSKVAIIESGNSNQNLSVGTINLTEYQPKYLKYQSSNRGQGYAVFSEIYYEKGWKAFIDGTEAEIQQTNYVLRGLLVPAGDHTIEFRFEPKSYSIGNSIMLLGSIFTIGLLIFSIVFESRNFLKS